MRSNRAPGLAGRALLVRCGRTAGAILASAPIASADDPSVECVPQEAPNCEQQQPEQQQPNLDPRSLPITPNPDNGNPQQAPQQPPPTSYQQIALLCSLNRWSCYRLMLPAAQPPDTGAMPRTAQCNTGMRTARDPSGRSPTTSWPSTNGNDTIGSK